MNRTRGSLRSTLALSLTGAATTWAAMLSWRPFAELPGRFLGPLVLVGLVVAGTGALVRWWRLPVALVLSAQLVAGAVVTCLLLTGRPLPLGGGWTELQLVFGQAVDSAQQYAAPVPASAPGLHPLLVAGGLACFLLVDVLVVTLRRPSLAGLPLLTIYSVPISLVGGGLSWWIFALTAVGFLVLLYLHEADQVDRWGRPLDEEDPSAFDVRTGRVRAAAGGLGGVATALAVAVPVVIPTLDIHLVDFGNGPGGDGDITLSNPMTDLKRDLVRGEDVPLLRLRTDDPRPSYLRVSALKSFNGETWSAGEREVPVDNLADGALPGLPGVAPGVDRRSFDYQVSVTDSFDSDWLPTMATSTRVEAVGDWRYDVRTRDFLAADEDLDTAGVEYSMTGVDLDYDAIDMARAPSLGGQVDPEFIDLPDGMPTEVRNLALQVTREAPTRYEKAVALQRWFRETGGFTYSTAREEGNGTDDLLAFLRSDGRVGYCEQFSAAMAVMARMLGIPARVAVGFLVPERVGQDTWEYSSHDLHAWPELFFPGSGWVRFEPTPAARARSVPAWTRQDVPAPDPLGGPSESATTGADTPDRVDEEAAAPVEEEDSDASAAAEDRDRWAPVLLPTLIVVALLLALALLPRTIRSRRREQRLSLGPEAAWAEVRATALDLRLRWPEHRSPRETRRWLVEQLGADPAPGAVRSLDRLVEPLEELRYSARGGAAPGELRTEVRSVVEALEGVATPRTRRAATWLPRSVLTPVRPPRPTSTDDRYGVVVDHVGS